MLSFFRRLINSKAGLAITFVVLGLIALAFASGDVSSLRTQGMAALGGGDAVVRVGKTSVSPAEFGQRVTQEMEAFRQQQPTVDLPQFIAGGGLEGTLERTINGLALEQFGEQQGMLISKRAVDGQIASIPALQGPNGEFDPQMFQQLLAQRKLTEASVRADLRRDLMGRLLTQALLRPGQAPEQLALPYASLLLEKRQGEIALIPTAAMPAGPAPTDAELQAFYNRNLPRYTVAERRVIRYARVTPEQVAARATPAEAEIAAAYKQDAGKYSATEKRSVTQVVVLDQAGAQALAAKVKGGQDLAAAAARAAGLEPSKLTDLNKAALAQRASPALADAVFAAATGAVVGPVRGGLGYTVAKVDAVQQVAGRTLAQAHDEIAAALIKQKAADALNTLHDAIDDKLTDNATFDELVADQKLTAANTGALLANGTDPEKPGTPDPALAPLVQAAFQMQDGDEPQMVPTGADGSFALVALGRIVPVAPRPLAQVREQVARDVAADRARQAARRIAGQVLAAVNKGQTLQQAWAATGLRAAPPHALAASREDIDRAQGPARAPLALMFAMAKGSAKLLEAPGGAGWAVIKLDGITPGDASRDAQRIAGTRGAFGQVLSREYVEQFARAARASVGVTVNQANVARVKQDLLGGGGGNAPAR